MTEKQNALAESINIMDAAVQRAAERTHTTGMRTQVNGLLPLPVMRVLEAARRFAAIRDAVERGTHALVPVIPTDEMAIVGNSEAGWGTLEDTNPYATAHSVYAAMLRAHGTDPLIDNQGGE